MSALKSAHRSVGKKYWSPLLHRCWFGNQIALPLKDKDGLVHRDFSVRWRLVYAAIKLCVIRFILFEDVIDSGQQHSGNGNDRFVMTTPFLETYDLKGKATRNNYAMTLLLICRRAR